jgi:hypothetical protein
VLGYQVAGEGSILWRDNRSSLAIGGPRSVVARIRRGQGSSWPGFVVAMFLGANRDATERVPPPTGRYSVQP